MNVYVTGPRSLDFLIKDVAEKLPLSMGMVAAAFLNVEYWKPGMDIDEEYDKVMWADTVIFVPLASGVKDDRIKALLRFCKASRKEVICQDYPEVQDGSEGLTEAFTEGSNDAPLTGEVVDDPDTVVQKSVEQGCLPQDMAEAIFKDMFSSFWGLGGMVDGNKG